MSRKKNKNKKKKSIFQNVISKIENKAKPTYQTNLPKVQCHIGFSEIYENLFVGRERDLNSDFVKDIDVLIPLNDLDGRIWDRGFVGDIMYVPIEDYSVLPKDIEKRYVNRTLELLRDGKKVAIFCLGGHGRTGYFASLVLYELGIENPIKFIREKYCVNAIEDKSQLIAIGEYMGSEEIIKEYESGFAKIQYSNWNSWYHDDYLIGRYDTYGKYDTEKNDYYNPSKYPYTYSSKDIEQKKERSDLFSDILRKEKCKNCAEYFDNICLLDGSTITEYDDACEDFISAI